MGRLRNAGGGMSTPEYSDAVSIQVSKNAKALLRDLGWSDEKIEATLRKPQRHGHAIKVSSPRME
jgi:hypothetical protein